MLDPDILPAIRAAIRRQTRSDGGVLDELRADVRRMCADVRPVRARSTTAISLVASDGGNNRLEYDPFSIQLVRVVDSYGQDFLLDAVSPTTDTDELSRRHLGASGAPASALGRLMGDLGVDRLSALSTMIPAGERVRRDPGSVSASWVSVYRDLCEWAVLVERLRHTEFATDTLLVHDGLLRELVFAGDLFVRMGELMREAIEGHWRERRRRVYLVGVAKHSRVIERYRLAMQIEAMMPAGGPRYVRVPGDIEQRVYRWPDYARAPGDAAPGGKTARSVLGRLHLVRFGERASDPVWPVDIFHTQVAATDAILGHLLADALDGFPVPFYPRCLQKAHEHAQIVDFDLRILQDEVVAAVRGLLPRGGEDAVDRLAMQTDVAANRYG